jgi:hypothetical protein
MAKKLIALISTKAKSPKQVAKALVNAVKKYKKVNWKNRMGWTEEDEKSLEVTKGEAVDALNRSQENK